MSALKIHFLLSTFMDKLKSNYKRLLSKAFTKYIDSSVISLKKLTIILYFVILPPFLLKRLLIICFTN